MVYGFARQAGGDVRVESKLGEGTTISLYFPLAVSGSEKGNQHQQ
jgi:signal transduction histidine kinase